ncbi:MAG: hypothetical protein IPM82_07520 [Saprospiraceae bacterium]|nr:hypothetical protein [Saprospiraceae bacterium]
MKKFLFLLIAAAGIFSCNDDDQPAADSTTVNLNFKAEYDGSPLVLYQALDYPDGKQIRMQNFNFFVSNITLLGEGATPDHLLTEVEFFDFKDNLDLAAAQTALTRKYEKCRPAPTKASKLTLAYRPASTTPTLGSLTTATRFARLFPAIFGLIGAALFL